MPRSLAEGVQHVAAEALFAVHGVPAIYRKAGGGERALYAVTGNPQKSETHGFAAAMVEPKSAKLRVADLAVEPAAGDTIEIDGTLYDVRVPAARNANGTVFEVRLAEVVA